MIAEARAIFPILKGISGTMADDLDRFDRAILRELASDGRMAVT